MARATVLTYECTRCGSEIVVTGMPETELSPIYCCGMEVAEVVSSEQTAKPKKKTATGTAGKAVKKTPKKAAKKTAPPKKKPALKKKASKK